MKFKVLLICLMLISIECFLRKKKDNNESDLAKKSPNEVKSMEEEKKYTSEECLNCKCIIAKMGSKDIIINNYDSPNPDYIFPKAYQLSQNQNNGSKVRKKAIKQNKAARNFFYNTNEDKIKQGHFSKLAENLMELLAYTFKDDSNENMKSLLDIVIDDKINRQIFDKDEEHKKIIEKDIEKKAEKKVEWEEDLKKQGIKVIHRLKKEKNHDERTYSSLSRFYSSLKKPYLDEKKVQIDREFYYKKITKEEHDKLLQVDIKPVEVFKKLLDKMSKIIIEKDRNRRYKTAIEYVGFLGILGDMGAVVQDHYNRDSTNEGQPQKDLIAGLEKIYGKAELEKLSKSFYELYSPDKYYDSEDKTITKKKERGFCVNHEKKLILEARTGILNLGSQADEEQKTDRRYHKDHLLPISWPWQTVPKKLIDSCKREDESISEEPWAGHFSGSLYELILMQELLGRDQKAIDNVDDKKRNLYFATAASFLIATGMHSATEVNWVGKMYLNQGTSGPKKINYEEYMSKYCSSSTDDIASLLNSYNTLNYDDK